MAESNPYADESKTMEDAAQHSAAVPSAEVDRALCDAGVAAWMLDVQRDELAWAGATELLLSCHPAREAFEQLIHPQDVQWVVAARRRAFNGEIPYQFEYRLRLPHGDVRWVLDRGRVERNEAGEVRRVRGTLIDITERRAGEERSCLQSDIGRIIAANSAESIFLTDADGRVTFLNSEAERTFGYTAAESKGAVLHEVIQPTVPGGKHPHGSVLPLRQILSSGASVRNHEDIFIRRDGTPVHVVCSHAAILTEGKFTGSVLVAQDVTQQKATENRLREREQRLFLAQAAANMHTWQAELVSDRRRAFPLLTRITGLPEGDFEGIGEWESSIHPKDRPWLLDRLREVLAGRQELDVAYRTLRADGTIRWTASKGLLQRTPAGKPQSIIGVASDITDRKEAERALAISEERYRSLARVLTSIVWSTDPEGAFVSPQPEWEAYTGQSWEEYQSYSWSEAVHPEERAAVLQMWRDAVAKRVPYEASGRIWHFASQSYHHFVARAVPLLGTDGAVREWIGTITDVNEQVRARQELERSAEQARRAQLDAEQAREEAVRANLAKDAFLAALSHELRTPLTPVLLSAAALRKDPAVPEAIRRQLAMMQRNVELEAQLIDDLLDLTRISRGKLQLRKQDCDAHALLLHAAEIVRSEAEQKHIALELDLATGDAWVCADPARLQQVFWNLLRNAVKFTGPEGKVTVRTLLLPNEQGAPETARAPFERLSVEVIDSGIGIEPKQISRIFEPFEQGGLTNDHRFGGLGLGLAISRTIVELHEGEIRASSAGPGQGSRFTVELALVPADHKPSAPVETARPPRSPLASDVGSQRALNILLVEDHAHTLEMLQYLLRRQGHRVTGAPTVHAAVAASKVERFDCLVSDLGLPDGTGVELLASLRALQPDLPAIALSGYGMEEDYAKTRDAGFAVHLTKPVEFDRLQEAIAEAMNASATN